jgi:hypothetical protein
MKEILESINLPKQILDKTEKVISTILGPSAKEIGEMFADRIRYKRLKNQIAIFSKTADLLEKNNLQANELNLKTLVPLIEKSSLEDDEVLQNKWANLITNMCSTPETGLEPKLVKTLSNLSSLEAKVLDYIFERFTIERRQQFERRLDYKWLNYSKEEDVKLHFVIIRLSCIKKRFSLTEAFAKICIDNLESLGLIRYEEPEIEIQNDSRNAEVKEEVSMGQYVDLDLDIYANYNQSEDFYLTVYGNYFINQCKVN